MKTLSQHRLFRYFMSCTNQGIQFTTEELSSAYEEYALFLSNFSAEPLSTTEKLRQLYYAEVELTALLQLLIKHSDALVKVYLHKAIRLIKIEIKLNYLSIRHTGDRIPHPDATPSSLHWKSSLINLMELIASLDYSGIVTDSSGQRQSFAGLVAAFEKLFNISIPKPYDLRADLARRKKSFSVLLPQLKDIYEKNIVSCGIQKKW